MVTTPVLWKPLSQINASDGAAIQANAQVAPLSNGGYLVVWVDGSHVHNPGGSAIIGQRYNVLGDKVGGEVLLSKLANGQQANAFQPAVTTLSNGNVAVAFMDQSTSNNVYVRIFDPALTFVRQDTIATTGAEEFDPSLTALAGASYAVGYSRGVDVIARFVSGTGSVGNPVEIYPNLSTQGDSELARLANGNLVTVFQVESIGTSIFYYRFDIRTPGGTPVSEAELPGGSSLEVRPNVAALKGGGFTIVWTDNSDGSGTGIRTATYNHLGNAVNDGVGHAGIRVNASTTGNQNDSSVVALADGGFLVAWEDENAGKIHGQRFNSLGNKVGGEFVMSHSVTPSATEAPIRMALLADGRVALVANNKVGADYDVITSIWDPRTGPVTGTAASEVLTGTPGGATVDGPAGNDTLIGRSGPDVLDGGTGNDVMTGGPGADLFFFEVTPNKKTNLDHITDFAPGVDEISLDKSVFKKLKVGDLAKKAFFGKPGAKKAKDGKDRIIYDEDTGLCGYDVDGKGGKKAKPFAILDNSPDNLSHLDFDIVA
jgi:Ca2+-binding RTX toxin-like protein